MSSSSLKPTALILGGLSHSSLSPALSLLPSLFPITRHIRIVDKPLVLTRGGEDGKGAFTTWLDGESKKLLDRGMWDDEYVEGGKRGKIEYVQGNLLMPVTQSTAFKLPSQFLDPSIPQDQTQSYDWVFDFTGADSSIGLGTEWVEDLHISRTVLLARQLGRAALASRPGGPFAYIRQLTNNYRPIKEKGKPITEKGENAEVWGDTGKWIHTAARGLANLDGLRLVLIRPALGYGPYIPGGFTRRLLIGDIYRYTGEKVEFLWDEDLRFHTLHSADFASSCLALANYFTDKVPFPGPIPDELLESLPPCRTGKKEKDIDDPDGPPPFPARHEMVKAAVFNVADDGDTTQKRMAEIVGKVIGVKVGFHGSVISHFAKLNFGDVLEEANEKHLEPWPEMLLKSDPPITSTPLSPHLHADLLSHEGVYLDNSKLKRVTGWTPSYPQIEEDEVRKIVELFKQERVWPNAPPPEKKSKK